MTETLQPPARPAQRCGEVLFWRANPLPRKRITHPDIVNLLRELSTVESKLAALAGKCSDALYTEIGASSGTRRAELLRLRRDIHNGRTPPRVPGDLPAPARDWCRTAADREALCTAIRAAHPAAVDAERALAGDLLADQDLQRALALVSPEVYRAALTYRRALAGEPVASPARLRKSERGLLQYLTRAMVRTSPLSRFTAVGLAVTADDGVPLAGFGFPGAAAVLSLDLAMTRYLAGGLAPADADPWLIVAPTLRVSADTANVQFLRPAGAKAHRLSAPLTEPLHALLAQTAMGPRRRSALTAALTTVLRIEPDPAATLIDSATRVGMLCSVTGPDSELPPLPSDAMTLHAELAATAADLRTLAVAPAADRAQRLEAITVAADTLARTVARPARLTVNEDYVGAPSTVSTAGCALPDLNDTVELLSLYDRMHQVRALAAAAFVERFGAGANVSLTEHAEALVTTVYRREQALTPATAADLGPADGSLPLLYAVREAATTAAHARIDAAVADGADEVRWDPGELAGLAAALPARFRAGPLSYGVLVQPSGDDLVFNDAYAGNAMLYGRFLAADTAAGGTAAARLAGQLQRWYGADGARVVEDRGLHGMSINHHQPVLPDGLDAQDWYALRLVHDPVTGLLGVQDADGRPVRVLTLGVAMPDLHPYPLRLANWLVAGGRLIRNVAERWHAATGHPAVPRLRAGSVIFSRRRWYSDEFAALATARDLDDAQRLVELTRWRARHGVPEQVLLKVPVRPWSPAERSGPPPKPQYVDLASALQTRTLPRMLGRRENGYLEEALPAVDASAHAVEWVAELVRPSGGRFGERA